MNIDDTIDGYFDGTGTGTPSRGGFWQKYRYFIIGLPVVAGVVALAMGMSSKTSSKPAPKKQESMIVPVTPMPPPPKVEPPPPQQEPEPEKTEEIKQEEIVEEPEEAPPEDAPPTTTGPVGNDAFGLKKGNGGSGARAATGPRRIGGKWDRYALSLQNSIAGGLRRHSLMKKAAVTVGVKIWVDSSGLVTRAAISSSSGDSALDTALRSEILPGMQLAEPPPADMPMPINLQVTARRPN